MTEYETAQHSDDLVEEEGEHVEGGDGGNDVENDGGNNGGGEEVAQAAVSAHCPKCNYDLSGILEAGERRCPECGHVWTVDELAQQHAAQMMRRRGVERWLWIMLPGPISCGVLFLGLVFGHLVWWLAITGTIAYVVVTVMEWWRESYLRSFAKGRGKWNRYGFVSGVVAVYLFVNIIEIALLILLVQIVLMRA